MVRKSEMNPGPAASDGVVDIPIGDIKIDFYIREGLDEDRVRHFINLILSGQNVPPIRITRDLKVIDGRHRYEAHVRTERAVISCITKNISDPRKQIISAFDANYIGSMPPTQRDIGRVVRMLFEAGASRDFVRDHLKLGYSAELMNRIMDDAQSALRKKKLLKAKNLIINDNLSLKDAAKIAKVDEKDVKKFITGEKDKDDAKKEKFTIDLAQLKRDQTKRNRSFSKMTNARTIDVVVEAYDLGLVFDADVLEVMDKSLVALQSMIRTITVKKERFVSEHDLQDKKLIKKE